MKRVDWAIEEMVAIVELYYKYKNNEISDIESSLITLSKKLNKRADLLGIEHDEKYRNYNGMKMIFENIHYIDSKGEKGLSGSSELMRSVTELYHSNLYIFNQIAKEFNKNYKI